MNLNRMTRGDVAFRFLLGLSTLGLCILIGCGNFGAGCRPVDNCPDDPEKTQPGECGCGVADEDTDTDGDGVMDCIDNCPATVNPDQEDGDDNGIGDVCEGIIVDGDGDGVADGEDNCADEPNADQTDTDDDGHGDACDGCPDDANKTEPGTCGCGSPDTDSDGDGILDCGDNCPSIDNPGQEDGDENGVGDACEEEDRDGDGVDDGDDNCVDEPNADQADADDDGFGDACDACPNDADKTEAGVCGCGVADDDTDGDGVEDCNDGCPDDPDKDAPGDCGCGVVDTDTDTDTDGVLDCNDNCPFTSNPDQEDVCPDDVDSDGVLDESDNCPGVPNPAPQEDDDQDGSGNECDICPGFDDAADGDADGVPDGCDACEGSDDAIDTDGDDAPDGCDLCPGFDDTSDADADGVPDECDNCPNAANDGQADADDDGVGNVCDSCPNDASDSCGGGGGDPDPTVGIDAGADRDTSPCELVTLTANTSPGSATVTWTDDTGAAQGFVDNGDGTATFTAATTPIAADLVMTFTATGSAGGHQNGSDSVAVTLLAFATLPELATKSSGAAQPGQVVTLSVHESVPVGLGAPVAWAQDPGDPDQVADLTLDGIGGATFTAPAVTASTDLNFTVTTSSCSPDQRSGTVSVQIQVATLVFALTEVAVGDPLDLSACAFAGLQGQPDEFVFIFSIDDSPGVTHTYDSVTQILTVTSGNVGETLTVIAEVWAAAGLLASTGPATITIATSPAACP